jgi:hypothetical protein
VISGVACSRFAQSSSEFAQSSSDDWDFSELVRRKAKSDSYRLENYFVMSAGFKKRLLTR